jgi:hypothetical protein
VADSGPFGAGAPFGHVAEPAFRGPKGQYARLRARALLENSMTAVPAVAAVLAGFVLAHAAWSISDLPNGDGFVPLAVVVVKGERRLQRFAGSPADEAVAKGRAAMRTAMSSADAWAFAYNSVTVTGGQRSHAIHVEFWSKEMAAPATLVQTYQPMTDSARFKIIAEPTIRPDAATSGNPEPDILRNVRKGIASHPRVASLWDTWR